MIYNIKMLKQVRKTNKNRNQNQKSLEFDSNQLGELQKFPSLQKQIEKQLQQCDDLQSVIINQDERVQQKTSFVSNMTERKRIQKKKKITNYLEENRNNIPTHRENKGFSQFILDEDDILNTGNLENQLKEIQNTVTANKEFQQFILMFNKDPEKAIQIKIKQRKIKKDDPDHIANYLLMIQKINKTALGQYFGHNNPKSLQTLRSYCDLLGFQKIQYDIALRTLLSKFRLPGEAQQIQRIVWQFSQSYHNQNKNKSYNSDQLFPLAYSIIMLATDAHNPQQQKKMTCPQFIKNTQNACPSIGKQYLQKLYHRIVKQKLQTQKTVYDKLPDFYLPNINDALNFAQFLKKGSIVWKIVLNNKKMFNFKSSKKCQYFKRKLFLSEDQQKICWLDPQNEKQQPRYIWIKNITDLTIGIAEHLQTKKNIPKQCQVEFFTITTPQRTLDIRTQTAKVRSKWLNYLRAVMIQKRQKKKQVQQSRYFSSNRKQKLQEAWNVLVFPHWDQYWDYELKKPLQKGFLKQKVQRFCYCFKRSPNINNQNLHDIMLDFPIKNGKHNILDSLWSQGLLLTFRKPLWQQIIGNALQMNQLMIQDTKKRSIFSMKLRQIQQDPDVIQTAQFIITIRPDLPHIKNLLQACKVFHKVFSNQFQKNRLIAVTNLIHKHHFLPFYKGDRHQIQLRTRLFQFLLQKNIPFVKLHFQAIKLQTKIYLVPWFLQIFSTLFSGQFLLRIWDNFLLEGEIYLFKVGITLIKYFEIQLKMCTFLQGLKFIKNKNVQKSPILFFSILEKQIDVRNEYYHEYITKRKNAITKTKIQSIHLE